MFNILVKSLKAIHYHNWKSSSTQDKTKNTTGYSNVPNTFNWIYLILTFKVEFLYEIPDDYLSNLPASPFTVINLSLLTIPHETNPTVHLTQMS